MIKQYSITQITQKIEYEFKDPQILEEALTHPNCLGFGAASPKKSYERLEFLGDAVLTFIITEFLIKNFPEETEGNLTKRRAALVNSNTLSIIGRDLDILEYLVAGSIEEFNESEASKVIEDVTEALLGAMYLDGGIDVCKQFVMKYWEPFLFKEVTPQDDPKTYLQEWSQKRGFGIPAYRLISKTGEAHSPIFTIEVKVSSLPTFTSVSTSKKFAEKEAAKELIKYIQSNHSNE